MTDRQIINAAVREAGLWDGEHAWEQYGYDHDEICQHCHGERGFTDAEDSCLCPGPEHWSLDVLWDTAREICGDLSVTDCGEKDGLPREVYVRWMQTLTGPKKRTKAGSLREALEAAIVAAWKERRTDD